MKITDIKTFIVDAYRTNWVFVKVYTDDGIDGVGEGTLEYKEKALVGAIDHIKSCLAAKIRDRSRSIITIFTVMRIGAAARC